MLSTAHLCTDWKSLPLVSSWVSPRNEVLVPAGKLCLPSSPSATGAGLSLPALAQSLVGVNKQQPHLCSWLWGQGWQIILAGLKALLAQGK